jgi:hypothetical protein
LNAAQTAKNLVCAKAYGVSSEAILGELASKHAALCGESTSCSLQSTLETWAKQSVPVELSTAMAVKPANK